MPKISDALMETYLWLSGYEGETQGPCASRCIIDAAAKFAGAASRNDRRPISGHQLKIDSPPASPLTQPGHIRDGSRGNHGQGSLPVIPPVIANTGTEQVARPTPSCAIGGPCRSGKRRKAHELVSRHPNMLGICVGGNRLMIGIPKVLLEKNPGSSSSAFLHGLLGPWISMLGLTG